MNYVVVKSSYDASRPFQVLATFRSFNKGMGRYATERAAKQRASYLNRRSEV